MSTEIHQCRICGNANLTKLIDLGEQALTGVFPADEDEKIETMPIKLVKCMGENTCGLVQLKHSGSPEEMYGMNYGYRSGINQSMVQHLEGIYKQSLELGTPGKDDVILDIGSNDATLLKFYKNDDNFNLIGIDPTGVKFKEYYPSHIKLVSDFFSEQTFLQASNNVKARIVTSIAMVYDLEDPQTFFDEIASVLADDGIWIFEQSYLPSMLAMNAYDTICHEHLEYYALKQIVWLLERADMKVIAVSLNDSNGGSFRVTAAKKTHPVANKFDDHAPEVLALLQKEENEGIHTLEIYDKFRKRVLHHRDQLIAMLKKMKESGKIVFGLGASTKGNVILQFCDIGLNLLPCIAEVNEDKFGCFTPTTHIPIISQKEADAKKPDYYLVLPWHFRKGIEKGMSEYVQSGGSLIFPLPKLVVVDRYEERENCSRTSESSHAQCSA